MKRTTAKLIIALVVSLMVMASCRGPRECWGVTSDKDGPATEQNHG